MSGANNMNVNGQTISSKLFDAVSAKSIENNVVNSVVEKSMLASVIRDNINKNDEK